MIFAAVAVVGVIVLITTPLRLHAFLALTLGSLFMGLASGLKPAKAISSYETGVGTVLGSVGVILALGTMLGKLLAESGGSDQIAATLLRRTGPARVPWAMALVAMIVGIPLFFEIGVVMLMPLIFTMARRVRDSAGGADGVTPDRFAGRSVYLMVGMPALAGLSVLHGLIPPHPGPLIAVAAVKADLGTTLLYGLIVAVPTVAIAGPLFARFASRYADPRPPPNLIEQLVHETPDERDRPGFAVTLLTVLLPVALMLVRTVADLRLDSGSGVRTWCDFIGDPVVALLAAVLLAMYTFGFARGFGGRRIGEFFTESLMPAASILLIIGAGGGFKQLLVDSGVGKALAKAAHHTHLSTLILAWLIAVLIRLATGSATVATVTAAGIMAPLVNADHGVSRPLVALAIGAGSLFLSHVNDAGFWLIKEYFGMSVGETLRTWSAMETLISVLGLGFILALSLVA
ncbi:MAG: gluconate:H+ symporter [Mycobacteriales bacterium]